MSLAFRNIDISPADPVEVWPTEAVLTALARGGLGHWRRLTAAIDEDPWGPVARRVEEADQDGVRFGDRHLGVAAVHLPER